MSSSRLTRKKRSSRERQASRSPRSAHFAGGVMISSEVSWTPAVTAISLGAGLSWPAVSSLRRAANDAIGRAVRGRWIARHYADAVAPVPHLKAAPGAYQRYLRDRKRYIELSGEEL